MRYSMETPSRVHKDNHTGYAAIAPSRNVYLDELKLFFQWPLRDQRQVKMDKYAHKTLPFQAFSWL